jgi:hypothetical protein
MLQPGLHANRQELSMNTIDGIRFVSDDELATVVGGMMNNGQGDFLQTPKNTGGPTGGSTWGDILKGAEIVGAAALVTVAALYGGG